MATINLTARPHVRTADVVARIMVVGLTLATAAIHVSLGGLLFLMNALAYAFFAVAMVVPGPLGRIRWLVRLALLGFTAATIGGWVLFGARFSLAYLDKGIELGLMAAIAFEIWRLDGGPIGIVRQAHGLMARVVGSRVAGGSR